MITDREGRPLAVSVMANAVWVDPHALLSQGGVTDDPRWKALSETLSLPLKEISRRIQSHSESRFVYLSRQVSPTLGEYIKKLALPGVYLREEARRYYPAGPAISHLIGITNIDDEGIEGVEKVLMPDLLLVSVSEPYVKIVMVA